ncbi:mechanosensitive ion channel [Rhodobacteraceae bacterium CCMM004]|nr:mechanosensitive ion channel [Rhodobacteraceae bacterium CCMM004]
MRRAICAVLIAIAPLMAAAQEVSAVYEVDTLNAGLGDVPDRIDRATPQGAVESFLDAIDDGDAAAAAHVLNLNGIPEDERALRAPILAVELDAVLRRKAVISWRALLERPDALDANQSSNAAMAGQPRKSLLIDVLDLGDREAAIRLNRVQPEGGDPVWVFSERTVSKIPALYDEYGPSDFERALPDVLRADAALGLKRWEILVLPLAIGAAWLLGWALYRLFEILSSRASRDWTTEVLSALRWPSIIFAATYVMGTVTTDLFTVSGAVGTVITPLIVIGYVTAALLFALSVIDSALERITTFDSGDLADPDNSKLRGLTTTMSAARKALIVIGLLIALGVVLASINAYRSLGFSLLASAGAATLVLGFAAREVLGNIMASLQIALNRSARIGDRVIYKGNWCHVERIHFTFVQLEIWNGNRLVVPVAEFVSEAFENWSLVTSDMIWPVELTLAQEADVDALRERFVEIAEAEDELAPKDEAKVLVLSQDAFGKVVRFYCPSEDPSTGWDMSCRMREKLLAAARDIEDETNRPMLPQAGMDEMAA